MMLRISAGRRVLRAMGDAAGVISCTAFLLLATPAFADCRTGAVALGNAHIRANPMYAMFFGELESYVDQNRAHFVTDGDAIRCARVLSQALVTGGHRAYDPNWERSQSALRSGMASVGMSPGSYEASPSAQLYAMGQQISWLARVLPSAAAGNYGPMRTPTTEEEQMRIFAGQMFQLLLQDPAVRDTFHQMEPLIREAAQFEYQMLVGIGQQLDQ